MSDLSHFTLGELCVLEDGLCVLEDGLCVLEGGLCVLEGVTMN